MPTSHQFQQLGSTWKLSQSKTASNIVTNNLSYFLISNDVSYKVWDLGGKPIIRRLWRHHFQDAAAVIFVIDSQVWNNISIDHGSCLLWDFCKNEATLEVVRKELDSLWEDPHLAGVPILFLANKQDLAGALSSDVIWQRLGLDQVQQFRR